MIAEVGTHFSRLAIEKLTICLVQYKRIGNTRGKQKQTNKHTIFHTCLLAYFHLGTYLFYQMLGHGTISGLDIREPNNTWFVIISANTYLS